MNEVVKSIFENQLIASIITIIISIGIYSIFSKMILKTRKNNKIESKIDKKRKTYIRLITNVIKYAFIIITILILLQINGVNVSSMLAGVGILSVVIGLALQDALKDIIMGANIVTDNFFSIGDVVKYNGIEGKVIGFGLKTTKIQDLANQNIITISNRNITEIEKVSEYIYVDIPIPYELEPEKVEKVIESIVDKVKQGENVKECKYIGIGEFKDSSIMYKLEVQCVTEFKLKVRRYTLRCIKVVLDRNKIDIPYQQIDIHTK